MTAEIGILNKMGVALAADSAVTIGSDVNQKVYNSANKLFSLSKYHPVGVMIYGSAEFMGVPWEIIIKSYRKKLQKDRFDTIKEYVDDFLDFIVSDVRFYNDAAEQILVGRICNNALNNILGNEVTNEINRFINNGEVIEEAYVSEVLKDVLRQKISKIDTEKNAITQDGFLEKIQENYNSIVKEIIEEAVNFQIDEDLINLMSTYTGLLIQKEIFSDSFTGLVISGYGEEEIFPSLYEFYIEGIIFQELKYIERPAIKIGSVNDENHITAAMRPFAQKEMVHSFMNGIEPSLRNAILQFFSAGISQHLDYIDDLIDESKVDDWEKVKEEHHDTLLMSISESLNDFQEKYFTEPVMQILDVLPKEELAAMAEALVNLTSFKRKVTMDAETVGGPIDVAVITKGDGFVWIRRKHYFSPEFNHQFFQNYAKEE
ncbi:hypothetical protein OR571_01545 [Psychrobacillus sp. NEAU-3TGS]|uniref:hypothetical protein n=1 Tax=Psychrobacillus sp. NEAU-3TGS TaxID=2995412 RepID=UPI00249643DE|nr:hypothetical protein [Psychrobacillus sp. NEAU-3TGS]MDI2585845.1 hypothetical protein [Psychrobacillus sp. NEAU-3TGS]